MIGKGSFAKVYLSSKKETGQAYAIKAFNKEFMASQHKGKESLINEIGLLFYSIILKIFTNKYRSYEKSKK